MNIQSNETANSAKTSPKGKRRIIIMASIIVGLILVVSGAWMFLSWKVSEFVDEALAEQSEIGNDIECSNRRTTGYPFRIGIKCDTLAATLQSGAATFKAGELRTAAQLYDPGVAVGEIDGPFTLHGINGETVNGEWENARLSTKVSLSGEMQRFAILFNEPRIETRVELPNVDGPFLTNAEQIEFYMRKGEKENSVDVAYRLSGVDITLPKGSIVQQTGFNQLPVNPAPFNTTLNTNLEEVQDIVMSGGNLAAFVQDNGLKGFLRELALQPVNGGMLHLSGPFSIDNNGLLSGDFQLKFSQFGKVLGFLARIDPRIEQDLKGFEPIIENLAKPAEGNGEGQDAKAEKIHSIGFKVTDGKIRLGLFEIGAIPPIF